VKSRRGDEPDAVQVRVDVPQQLAADLGAGVRADGQHVIVFRPRNARIHPVDAARRPEHELTDAARAGQLQQVLRAADVDLLIAHWIGNRRPHARGRRQVHDDLDVVRERRQQRRVADIAFNQLPGGAVAVTGDVGQLERAGVERIEVVDDRNAIAVAKQRIHHVAADEAGATGDQHAGHRAIVFRASRSSLLTILQ
jgi:hypothetical protein